MRLRSLILTLLVLAPGATLAFVGAVRVQADYSNTPFSKERVFTLESLIGGLADSGTYKELSYSVSGVALPGILRLGVDLQMDFPASVYNGVPAGTEYIATSAFADTLTFAATEPGFLQLGMHFTGSIGGFGESFDMTYPGWFPAIPKPGFSSSFFHRMQASLTGAVVRVAASTRGTYREEIRQTNPLGDRAFIDSTQVAPGASFGSMVVSVPFSAGPAYSEFQVLMSGALGCRGSLGGGPYSWRSEATPVFPGARAGADCEASRSMVWTGFTATTLDGQPHQSLRFLSSESGADYTQSFLAPVPEPGTLALLLAGLVGICGARHKRS